MPTQGKPPEYHHAQIAKIVPERRKARPEPGFSMGTSDSIVALALVDGNIHQRVAKGPMVADRDTWRGIRGDFESLPDIEWGLIWTSGPGAQLAPIQPQSQWEWVHPQDARLQARANAVFLKAAKTRGYENEDQWLDELRYVDFVEFEFIGRATERLPDGTYTKSKSWVLKNAVKHSITLCHQLEAGDVPKPIIGRLPRETIATIEAATTAVMAKFELKLERKVPSLEKKPDRHVREAKLLREMVIYYFETAARGCMTLFSMGEFEAELRGGIARFVHFGVGQHEWLGDAMRKELDAGFNLFVMRADPWAHIPKKQRASIWHVGAITAEALFNTSLTMIEEAKARAADTLRDKNGATEPTADQFTPNDSGQALDETSESTCDSVPDQSPKHKSEAGIRKRPNAESWEHIEILFISDQRVQIRNGATSYSLNCDELSFADRRTHLPKKAWLTLAELAKRNGIFPLPTNSRREKSMKPFKDPEREQLAMREARGRGWSIVEKRIQEIRRALRKHFGISSDPIPFIDGTGYKACFKIRCAPSFET